MMRVSVTVTVTVSVSVSVHMSVRWQVELDGVVQEFCVPQEGIQTPKSTEWIKRNPHSRMGFDAGGLCQTRQI